MNKKQKLCRDCKWFSRTRKEESNYIGYPIYEFICKFDNEELSCQTERVGRVYRKDDPIRCGREGKYWEAKECKKK